MLKFIVIMKLSFTLLCDGAVTILVGASFR